MGESRQSKTRHYLKNKNMNKELIKEIGSWVLITILTLSGAFFLIASAIGILTGNVH